MFGIEWKEKSNWSLKWQQNQAKGYFPPSFFFLFLKEGQIFARQSKVRRNQVIKGAKSGRCLGGVDGEHT